MTSFMTSSGPIDLALGNLLEGHLLNLEEAKLLRVQCTTCLKSNRHLVLGCFQKVKIETDGVVGRQSCTRTAVTGIMSVTGNHPD